MELWDDNGRRGDGTRFLDLPGYGQEAQFLFEYYRGFDFRNFRGSLRIVALNGLISAVGIQLGSAAGQFTTLPIQPIYR